MEASNSQEAFPQVKMQENIVNKTPVISHSLKTFDLPPNFSPSEISRQSNLKGTKIFSYDGISDVKEESVHEEEIDMDAYFNVQSSKPKEEPNTSKP
jgi:hypothetical protein